MPSPAPSLLRALNHHLRRRLHRLLDRTWWVGAYMRSGIRSMWRRQKTSRTTTGQAIADLSPDAVAANQQGGLHIPAATTRPRPSLNLFWRTFVMMVLLMTASAMGWLLTLRTLDFEPRARQTAQQIASLVNLSRAALVYSDAITRFALMRTLAEEEGVRILPRDPEDVMESMRHDRLDERVISELRQHLGQQTIVASSVNGEPGLWIGFDIDDDAYWLLTDHSRLAPVDGTTWLVWMLMAGSLSLLGAAIMAGLVIQPLRQLSIAIHKIHQGDLDAGHLDEDVSTREIREVNIGFNRMAEQMVRIEHERTVMLAGISHDLRTPLARLRLEAEMSVPDEEARKYMVADIEQVDGIINKFMDYARPDVRSLQPVQLAAVVRSSVYPYLNAEDIRINSQVPENLIVMADAIELGRVVSNLIENARRYGKNPQSGITELDIAADAEGTRVHLQLADQGAGVPADILDKLTRPFYRADQARTAAAGSGLGLAIVKKVIEHMGGSFVLSNRAQGGLQAHIVLIRSEEAVT